MGTSSVPDQASGEDHLTLLRDRVLSELAKLDFPADWGDEESEETAAQYLCRFVATGGDVSDPYGSTMSDCLDELIEEIERLAVEDFWKYEARKPRCSKDARKLIRGAVQQLIGEILAKSGYQHGLYESADGE